MHSVLTAVMVIMYNTAIKRKKRGNVYEEVEKYRKKRGNV